MGRKKSDDDMYDDYDDISSRRKRIIEEEMQDYTIGLDEIEEENFDDDTESYHATPLRVGVVGYSDAEFDEVEATVALENIFDDLEQEYLDNGYDYIVVVSGGTNSGISKIAYNIATERSYGTSAIVPEQARNGELFDVDEIKWIGEKFGDESETFIDSIDILVKIGGGDQSNNEANMAEEKDIKVYEYDL